MLSYVTDLLAAFFINQKPARYHPECFLCFSGAFSIVVSEHLHTLRVPTERFRALHGFTQWRLVILYVNIPSVAFCSMNSQYIQLRLEAAAGNIHLAVKLEIGYHHPVYV